MNRILLFIILFLLSCSPRITNDEIQYFIENESSLKDLDRNGKVFIDDTLGLNRINIPVMSQYTHEDWVFIVGYTLFYELSKANYTEYLARGDSNKFFLSIIYNFKHPNPEALNRCNLQEDFLIFSKYENFYPLCKYVIKNVTPSDFQMFDKALEVLNKRQKNELFNRTFFDLFYSISQEVNRNDLYVLEKIKKWSIEVGDTILPNQIDYFCSLQKEIEEDIEIDLSGNN